MVSKFFKRLSSFGRAFFVQGVILFAIIIIGLIDWFIERVINGN